MLVARHRLGTKIVQDRVAIRALGVRARRVAVDQLAVLGAADVRRCRLVEDAEQAREHERQRRQRRLHARRARPERGARTAYGAAIDGGDQGA